MTNFPTDEVFLVQVIDNPLIRITEINPQVLDTVFISTITMSAQLFYQSDNF